MGSLECSICIHLHYVAASFRWKMFVATVSIFGQWPLWNLVINSFIDWDFCSKLMFLFPICKYLGTFKRFVEKKKRTLTFADMLMKTFSEIFHVQQIPLFQLPPFYTFSYSVSHRYFFLFLAREFVYHNLTWANPHVNHHVIWHHASSSF